MRSMEAYPRGAMERAMKVQDVILQARAKKIIGWQAGDPWDQRPAHAADSGALRGSGVQRIAGPASTHYAWEGSGSSFASPAFTTLPVGVVCSSGTITILEGRLYVARCAAT